MIPFKMTIPDEVRNQFSLPRFGTGIDCNRLILLSAVEEVVDVSSLDDWRTWTTTSKSS